jgi:hypothetical protein
MTDSSAARTLTTKRTAKMTSNQQFNANDLLNFTLPPRQTPVSHSLPRRSRKNATHLGVWNKESQYRVPLCMCYLVDPVRLIPGFVNAQYRFVMNPTGDYTVHFADPDM